MRFDDPLTRKVPSTSVPTGSKRDDVDQYGGRLGHQLFRTMLLEKQATASEWDVR